MCKLIVVTNRKLCTNDFLKQIELLASNGVDQIVLREKDMSEWDYTKLAKEVMNLCRRYDVTCVLHRFLGIAQKLNANGIHLSLNDAMKNRENLKSVTLAGVSTHSLEEIQLAAACHASYVFFGHVFPTDCKKDLPPKGIPLLQQVCKETDIPVYALGGLSPDNVEEVLDAGAAGACVMSWGMKATEEEVRSLVKFCHEYKRKDTMEHERDIFYELGVR